MMRTTLLPAVRMLIVLTFLTGVIYPLAVTAVAQVTFPYQANGSLITSADGDVIGSSLIGQAFTNEAYFWSRPSVIGYQPLPSGGSNLAPTSETLRQQVEERAAAIRAAHGLSANDSLPQDLLFASGSGLDPHISPEAARLQVQRVADARGMSYDEVRALVERFIEPPQWGVFGQPRVNVLLLNLALDGAGGG